ncbi:hypothetical protein B0T18DRAFT_180403 [Schizothecium vesticola]|uniref:Uncharacterized protein n=1 Tax=Schizothecium vesticola TaxID=314040 RepID=A0AA40EPT6_9PEZI|nr:hypothetical protein B0T18DRAFT_180403 [Schizothecium vesticola]
MVSLETPPSLESPTSCISDYGASIHQLFVRWRVQSRCRLRWRHPRLGTSTPSIKRIPQRLQFPRTQCCVNKPKETRLRKPDPRVPTCGMPERGSCMPVVSRRAVAADERGWLFRPPDDTKFPTWSHSSRSATAAVHRPRRVEKGFAENLVPTAAHDGEGSVPSTGNLEGTRSPNPDRSTTTSVLSDGRMYGVRRWVSGSTATLAVRHRLGRGGGGMQMHFVTNGTMVIRRGARCGCSGLRCSF